MHMTSSLPDGISMSELHALLQQADSEPAPRAERDSDQPLEPEFIIKTVSDAIHGVRREIGDVSAYKFLIMGAAKALFEFHNECAEELMKDDQYQPAIGWARDAGWLQVVLNTVAEICCGPNDFIYRERNPEEFGDS